MVSDGDTRLISAEVNATAEAAAWLMVTNGAGESASECDLLGVFVGAGRTVELTERELALALRDPAAARASCTARAWPEDVLATVGPDSVPLRVAWPRTPLRLPLAGDLWSGAVESVVLGATQDLAGLLHGFCDPTVSSGTWPCCRRTR
jgi:hypothetical protein